MAFSIPIIFRKSVKTVVFCRRSDIILQTAFFYGFFALTSTKYGRLRTKNLSVFGLIRYYINFTGTKKTVCRLRQTVERFSFLLGKLSEVLDCTNHLRSIRVLVVVPGNNLNLIQSVAEVGNHGLSSVEE